MNMVDRKPLSNISNTHAMMPPPPPRRNMDSAVKREKDVSVKKENVNFTGVTSDIQPNQKKPFAELGQTEHVSIEAKEPYDANTNDVKTTGEQVDQFLPTMTGVERIQCENNKRRRNNDELTQENVELTRKNVELTQENVELTQKIDELTRKNGEVTQSFDKCKRSLVKFLINLGVEDLIDEIPPEFRVH